MLKFIKPTLMTAIFMIVPCLLFGTACTSDLPNILPAGDGINSPVVITYLVKNPLEIITAEQGENDNYKRTLSIKGLSNQKVQESVNNTLEEIYGNMLEGDLPPYRGIRQKIGENSIINDSNLTASMSYNYNNVASILIYGNRTYKNQNSNDNMSNNPDTPDNTDSLINVGMMDAYNVDLNTGERILLKDVFADDVDYRTILNDYISKMLMKSNATEEEQEYFTMDGNLKLVSPFKGISDNQKFFLYQGGLGIIIDYNNPEFDMNLYPSTISISFEELDHVVAITERFYDVDSTLYESDSPPVYEFLQAWGGNDFREQSNENEGNVNIYRTLSYNKGIPKPALEKAKELYVIDENKLEELQQLTDPTSESWNSLEQYVWTNVTGEYSTVTRNISIYYNGQWKSQNENYCYDAAGNEIALADLFVSGVDYKSIIMNGLEKTLSEWPTFLNQTGDQLYNELQFSLGLSEINFTTIPVEFDKFSESPINFSVTYEEIGCDNLTIFH